MASGSGPSVVIDREDSESKRGIMLGAAAHAIWGLLPIYFHGLASAGALEVLGHRILWSAVFCVLAWVWLRDFGWVKPLMRSPRQLALLTLAAVILSGNWVIFLIAVMHGNIVETALGYFINPLLIVLLGVIFLHERLRPMQWTAVGLGFLAVAIMTIAYGRPPMIALSLALTFAAYGYIKKMIGGRVGALESMTVETLVLTPAALGLLAWLAWQGRGTFISDGPWHALMLVGLGVVTPLPLTLFAAAARRVPLSTMGMLQFSSPTISFMTGVFLFHEQVSVARWVGFGLIWLALVLLTVDSIRRLRARARSVITIADAAEAGATS